MPAFGNRWDRRHRLGMVFNQTLVKGHENASFRLAGASLWIERFRLVAGHIAEDVALWRCSAAVELTATGNNPARVHAKEECSDGEPCENLF